MIKIPFRWVLVSCVPGKNLGCSGSVLPVLPTFFNSVPLVRVSLVLLAGSGLLEEICRVGFAGSFETNNMINAI